MTSEYSLSVVQICPDLYKEQADLIAEGYGYGPNNLNVKLIAQDGSTWWGCHAWWIPEALDLVLQPPEEVTGVESILGHVITSISPNPYIQGAPVYSSPLDHWNAVLATYNMTLAG